VRSVCWLIELTLFLSVGLLVSNGLANDKPVREATADQSLVALAIDPVLDEPRPNPETPGSQQLSFDHDVLPALTKAGCNAGACHGSFQGRGGMRLSLLGYDPFADYDTLLKQSRGRRVNLAAPSRSLLLLKATGSVPHLGGRRITEQSAVYQVVLDWLADGGPPPTITDDSARPAALLLSAESLQLTTGQTHPLLVREQLAPTTRDVTRWALWDSNDPRVATVSRVGVVTAVGPGRTSIVARYRGQVTTISVTVPFATAATTTTESANTDFQPAEDRLSAELDRLVLKEWKSLGVRPAPLADDATFMRRVHLDLTGTLPTSDEVRRFLANTHPQKRTQLIDELLERPEYIDYWTLRWSDSLRAHRRYLGDKGLASYSGWIRHQVRSNRPLDAMVRDLLTAQGNLYTHGPVALYFIDEKVEDLTESVAQVFLGVRLQCARCHHHPMEAWSQDDYYGLANFFARIETKDSGQIGSRYGGPKSIRPTLQPQPQRVPLKAMPPRTLSGRQGPVTAPEGSPDVRVVFADWLTSADNPYFAKNLANRYWAALWGRGLVDPVDDLRATNPALMPELLDYLADLLRRNQYDAKLLLRTICRSQVYQRSYEGGSEGDREGRLLTRRIPRRLTAEVLLDALNQATGAQESFAGLPRGTRATQLPDPSIPSYFLTAFGRPNRNSPCDCARASAPDLAQTLHLANSTAVHSKVTDPQGRLAQLLASQRSNRELIDELILTTWSRWPTDEERAKVERLVADSPSRTEGWEDILWALLNSAEFSYVR
jgi:hypothetical protein